MHFDGFELCFLACFTATWQLLEGSKFFEEDVFGFWAVLAVPFLGPRGGPKNGTAGYTFFRFFIIR